MQTFKAEAKDVEPPETVSVSTWSKNILNAEQSLVSGHCTKASEANKTSPNLSPGKSFKKSLIFSFVNCNLLGFMSCANILLETSRTTKTSLLFCSTRFFEP